MTDRWKLLQEIRRAAPNILEAEVTVPCDSVWFAGHFPGEPILPGIAILHAVSEAIERDAQTRGETSRIASLKRVRFTGPVRPGDTILLHLTNEDVRKEKEVNFKVAHGGRIICTGQVVVTKTE
ncbi:MAG: MaoC/PaaZ C-terminal domain-containing protein [Smithellaceae bacterium]|nr:hypothetical protein [Syntrophaceae bacterium]MDD4241918.1 MaoC/PaaZ C-terminal domain-containing protein [Smithellaceae bacterium]NLX50901.1 hypothetical protein [Deltaproteobacteria bacterium]